MFLVWRQLVQNVCRDSITGINRGRKERHGAFRERGNTVWDRHRTREGATGFQAGQLVIPCRRRPSAADIPKQA